MLVAGTFVGHLLGHVSSVPLGINARYFLMETDETGTGEDNDGKQDSSLN